ncbi:MAG: RluA family pseudouridine synthase [Desulfobacterales bacterium]|nr:RluA family pseudouridine synthase [Desulfobacterales bacterium]MDD4073529.1 RluA family pseudouridine synthase [Desulfobacterales bacterium]MDD4391602.1 RluA family pseudouridine synthase [Desulfobacterales bacterium]
MKITASESGSILEVLKKAMGTDSNTRIRKYVRHGRVLCNGQRVLRPDMNINSGDVLEVTRAPAVASKRRVEPPVPVLYEDNDVIAVEKPAGMLTAGSGSEKNPSLHRLLRDYVQENAFHRTGVFVVHRLDREVSGVLIFAKSREIQMRIKQSWPTTEKRYYALVEGCPPKVEGTVESWLAEDEQQKVRSVPQSPEARYAVTHYRTLKPVGDHMLLEIRLETGRKNQIRVHMADIGCPIVGDRRYGASDRFVRRIRLHGFLFEFNHPVSGERLRIDSPMPEGFLKLLQHDEKYK